MPDNGQSSGISNNRDQSQEAAPGSPGSPAKWAPAAKSGVGCAISSESHIWFTLSRGIVTEVFHPWVDHAAIRGLGFVVTGPDGFLSEEQSDCASETRTSAPGIPAYRVTNLCTRGRYRISKEIIADPRRDVLRQRIEFMPLQGSLTDYRLFALLWPRLDDQGNDNSGWVGTYRERLMLFAQHAGHSLALAASAQWLHSSVGYVGTSDPRQDLELHRELTNEYGRADHGNIMLAGEIDIRSCGGKFELALGLDRSPEAAAVNASLSLVTPFEESRRGYVRDWKAWQDGVEPLDDRECARLISANAAQRDRPDSSRPRVMAADSPGSREESASANLFRASMMVLRVHRSKQFTGASVASLAVPWGEVRDDDDLGGYHLVWPRDLVEESFGFLAGGAVSEALDVLKYLRVTQKTNGGWSQDMWLDGSAYSSGVQLDEAALPILLVDLAAREAAVTEAEVESLWPMVRAAAGYIIRKGPSTGQDRWENTPGLSPYTLASDVAALLVAARSADRAGEAGLAEYLRETADLWNDQVEPWTYVTGTMLARRVGVEGYYVRIAPSPGMDSIRARGEEPRMGQARDAAVAEVVSPDALALVRFGLRAANDPRIVNTVKVIDEVNRVQTPAGPCWRRYNGGFYGENDAGDPYTGKDTNGRGRAWPLLTGERGHYEVARGDSEAARQMLSTMGGLASQIGLLPEQVWDSSDIPNRYLFLGRPAGSAMPLAWAHSEYVRLLRSIRDKRVFDRPADSYERYVKRGSKTDLALWRFDHQPASFPSGRRLRIELLAPAVAHFSTDGWRTQQDLESHDTGIGLHVVDLPTAKMRPGDMLRFTFRWPRAGDRWEGRDFQIAVAEAPGEAARAGDDESAARSRSVPARESNKGLVGAADSSR